MTETPPDRAGAVLGRRRRRFDPHGHRTRLRRLVAAHIESFPLQPTPFLDELVHLPSRFIVTLNYDDLLGYAAEQQGLKVCRLSAREPGRTA